MLCRLPSSSLIRASASRLPRKPPLSPRFPSSRRAFTHLPPFHSGRDPALASRRRGSSRLNHPSPAHSRSCSYRDNMCRMHGDGGGSVAAEQREVLPSNVKPTHYDLTMEPNFEKFTFDGRVEIELDVNAETDSITVNTLELEIHSATVSADGAVLSEAPKITHDKTTQRTTFGFDKKLAAGQKAKLAVSFTGDLNDKLAGFYRSSYKHPDGTTHFLATTQFEATDARRAFPCFDEPALKASFAVTLVGDPHHTFLSNMNVTSESEVDSKITGGKRKAVKFANSPPMSTYLLAFIIGEMSYIESNAFRVPVRVYTTPSSDVNHGKFSLDLAAKTLEFYEHTFDSKFPLPKMDMVAIPDFSAGAMENWGLVTYRSVDLLLDPAVSGALTKQRVAEVVQHELAHQWFGNLVTMDFWDGLWLNEGFATWMSWFSCNVFYPEWKIWESYVTDTLAHALALDSLRSSHPIEVPVKRADEINEIFDAISYSKGSSVLRMLSKHLGEDVFMEGIRRYLKKHAYGNTKTEDLWAALADASGKPVEEFMSVWTKNVGYPVVSVTENEQDKSITVKQNRFLKTADVKPEEDKTLYPVFLELKTKNGVDRNTTLSGREMTVQLEDLEFFKINTDQTGVYRTLYSPERLTKLGAASKSGLLSVEDRAGMLADAMALASSGYGKTSGALSFVKGLSSETEFVVWSQMLGSIGQVRNAWKFEDQATRDGLKALQLKLASPKARAKGWNFDGSEDHVEAQFKAMLFGAAGRVGDAEVIKAAQDMFARFVAGDRKAIPPNLRDSVYEMAVRHGGEAEFDALLREYETTRDGDERNTALACLGYARGEGLMARLLELPLSDRVKNQDIFIALKALRADAEGVERLWQWLTSNWDRVLERCPPSMALMGIVIKICTAEFATQGQIDRVHAFFKDKDTAGFRMSLEQSMDTVRAREGWLTRDRDDVHQFLKAEGLL